MFMQLLVIRLGGEQRIVIKEMDFLLVSHVDVGMPA